MTRLPELQRDELPPEAHAAWDSIAGSRGSVRGPHAMLMHVPPLAERVGALGEYLRFGGRLAGAERELAILASARELGSAYEWIAHEPIARREGTRPEAIAVVRDLDSTDVLDLRERLIIDVVRSLYRERGLAQSLYDEASVAFGAEQLVELVTLAGYYGMIAFVLLGFDVDLPSGVERPF